MKKMDDEELQKWLDENRLLSNKKVDDLMDDDAKAYHILFEALDTEPQKSLPYDFSAKVTRKVQADVKRNSELRYYLLSIGIFAVVAAVIYVLLTTIKPGKANVYLNILLEYKWVFILGVFSFLTIQYLDQVLVKANIFKR